MYLLLVTLVSSAFAQDHDHSHHTHGGDHTEEDEGHHDHEHVTGPWSVGFHGHGHIELPEGAPPGTLDGAPSEPAAEEEAHGNHMALRLGACNQWVCAGPSLALSGFGAWAEAHGHGEAAAWMAGVSWQQSTRFGHFDAEVGLGFPVSPNLSLGFTAAWMADGIDPFTQTVSGQFYGTGGIVFIEAPPLVDIHLSVLGGYEETFESREFAVCGGGGFALRF